MNLLETLAGLKALGANVPGGWSYHVRRDNSIYLSRGDPKQGAHEQWDFYGTKEFAALIVALVNALPEIDKAFSDMVAEREQARKAIAFAASCIKSGEAWTPFCEQVFAPFLSRKDDRA